jgi:subfamily B ATP-binding cassette protein MsbA
LLLHFYDPASGRILIDGQDIAGLTQESLRAAIGMVTQDTSLLHRSIRDNIRFGRPEATEDEIYAAAERAHAADFIEHLQDNEGRRGFDSHVGERGVKLSGGQRQRISIARAILADPRILILDEATSSLDSESEAMIQNGLNFLMQGRTTFVIAHRLSTIRRAEQILVIESGEILERGTHDELYKLAGRYYDLYTRQHGLETNLFLAPGEGDKVEAVTA